ncbi:MAG: hypothetical protein GY814_05790 [Gammaproteobacteria bacterium]|nr:hypothetical protein [Gammaproteobacteria bacterium]
MPRASVIQRKTGQPVRFEITEKARLALNEWISLAHLRADDWLFFSRAKPGFHITTR